MGSTRRNKPGGNLGKGTTMVSPRCRALAETPPEGRRARAGQRALDKAGQAVKEEQGSMTQYIRLNGRVVAVDNCPKCRERVFADKGLYGSLVELDRTCHRCPEVK